MGEGTCGKEDIFRAECKNSTKIERTRETNTNARVEVEPQLKCFLKFYIERKRLQISNFYMYVCLFGIIPNTCCLSDNVVTSTENEAKQF